MQRAHIPLLAAILVALFAGLAASPGARAQNANDRVGSASVIDGDTLEIHGRRIRLDGVDAPERGRRCGDVNVYQRAAQALDSFVEGRTVLCTIQGRLIATAAISASAVSPAPASMNSWSPKAGPAIGAAIAAALTPTRRHKRAPIVADSGGSPAPPTSGAIAITIELWAQPRERQ